MWVVSVVSMEVCRSLNESPSQKEGKSAARNVRSVDCALASMKALPRRKGNDRPQTQCWRRLQASMKALPRRKGNPRARE